MVLIQNRQFLDCANTAFSEWYELLAMHQIWQKPRNAFSFVYLSELQFVGTFDGTHGYNTFHLRKIRSHIRPFKNLELYIMHLKCLDELLEWILHIKTKKSVRINICPENYCLLSITDRLYSKISTSTTYHFTHNGHNEFTVQFPT